MSAAAAARSILTQLHEVMASRLHAQGKLNQVVDIFGEALNSEVCSIYLLREGMLELFATRGLNQIAVHVTRMGVGEGLTGTIAANVRRALGEGYRSLKLHEVDLAVIAAAREAAGPEIEITLDVNCPWSLREAVDMAAKLEPMRLRWLASASRQSPTGAAWAPISRTIPRCTSRRCSAMTHGSLPIFARGT